MKDLQGKAAFIIGVQAALASALPGANQELIAFKKALSKRSAMAQ